MDFGSFIFQAFFALMGACGMGVVTILWFILREMSKLSTQVGIAVEKLSAHDERIQKLEDVRPSHRKSKF